MSNVQTVLICAASVGAINNAPCPNGFIVSTAQAYLLDTTYIDPSSVPFDYTQAAEIFSLTFSSVIGLWLLARFAGTILNFLRGRK